MSHLNQASVALRVVTWEPSVKTNSLGKTLGRLTAVGLTKGRSFKVVLICSTNFDSGLILAAVSSAISTT